MSFNFNGHIWVPSRKAVNPKRVGPFNPNLAAFGPGNPFFTSGLMRKPTAGGGGGGTISDTFTYSDGDLDSVAGSAWTEVAGDLNIESGVLKTTTEGFGLALAVHNTPLSGPNGYAKVTCDGSGGFFDPIVVFRYTDAASSFYFVELINQDDDIQWNHRNGVSGTNTAIQTISLATFGLPQTIGVTWTGTGNSTEVRLWFNVTADAPDSVTSWDGDTTPEGLFQDNPGANAVDSGNIVGLGGFSGSAAFVTHDNFFAGPL